MKRQAIIATIMAFSLFHTSCQSDEKKDLVKENIEFASKQLPIAITEASEAVETKLKDREDKSMVGVPFSPRSLNKKGGLTLVAPRDWTSGFFPGTLWYMYEYTKDEQWKEYATKFTAPIESEKTNGRTHDMGFKIFNSFGNGYRLTQDETYKDIVIESAYTLATRYSPVVKAIRSWDHSSDKWEFPVIIDNMMNLELLFWVAKEKNDTTLYNIAVNHANTTMKNHFRDDYSSYHVVGYNKETGEVLQKNTHQGYSHESSWSRGQGWAIYGYTMCYRETKDVKYLEQAKNVANFIFSNPNMPEDLVPYWDFDAPNIPDEPKDVSAATIIASALYELSMYDHENADKYIEKANIIIQSLTDKYRVEEGAGHGFILSHSTGEKQANKEVDVPISYGDYYFLEALVRKHKLDTTGNIF